MKVHRGCAITEPLATSLPLTFACAEISEEFSRAVSQLKEVTDRTLFVWDSFSAPLPDSIVDTYGVAVAKLFRPADFDECDTLSRDSEGNFIRLDSEQLRKLRQYGEFDVKSENFPGEHHTWKVAPCILKGSTNIVISFIEDFSFSLSQLVIHARDRLIGQEPSVLQSLKMIWNSLYELLDLIFGLPHINHGDIDRKIHDERLRFITCELSVKSAKRKAVMDLWDAHEHLMCRKREVPKEAVEVKRPPYQFVTPARLTLDLRLHDTHLLQQCLKKILSLKNHSIGWFSDFKRNLVARLREEGKTMDEVKEVVRHDALHHQAAKVFEAIRSFRDLDDVGHGLAETLIQQASFSIIVQEVKEAFAVALLQHQNEELNRMQTQHRWLYCIPEWRRRQLHRSTRDYLEMHKFDIHESVLSKCALNGLEQHAFFVRRDLQFLKERERLLRQELVKSTSFADSQFIFTVSARLIRHWRVYRRENPGSTAHVPIQRVLVKNRTRPGDAGDAGICDYSPRYVRDTSAQCMRLRKSSSWQYPRQGVANQTPTIVSRVQEPVGFDPLLAMHYMGKPGQESLNSDAVWVDISARDIESGLSPYFLSSSQVSPPLSSPLCEASQPEYVVQSCFVYKTSTRHFMWRWLTFFVFTYSWLLRFGQLFLITIPFRTAFSLTAIFKASPIYLKVTVDQSTGHLFYDQTSYQDTLVSLLRRNWRQLRASRRRFDSAPAQGLLNKSVVSRPLHRVWCYLVRGLLTSFLLLLLWPPVCFVVSIVSLLVGVTMLVVLPAAFVGLQLLGLLVWDAHKPASKKNRWFPLPEVMFRRFLCGFFFQFTLSMVTACILCPVSMLFWLIWSVVRLACRSLWDAIIFNLIIRRYARVPARGDAMIKRVRGPGTSDNHFYRAQPLDVLVILLAQLELLELSLWRHQMDIVVNKPMVAYRRLVRSLSWLSVIPKAEGDIYNTLCTTTQKCQLIVASQFDTRVRDLRSDIKPEILMRIKLSDWDLRLTVRAATKLADVFFHRRILPRVLLLNHSPDVWWSGLNLSSGDFFGLSTSLLQQTFGENILTCIVETDTVFNFQAEDPQLFDKFHSYVKLLCTAEIALSQPAPTATASVEPATPGKLPSSSTPSTCVLPTRKDASDLATSSAPGSLTSDAVAYTSEMASQRCPALPCSPDLLPDLAESNGVDDSVGELLALLDEIRLTESCQIQSDSTTRRFDLIHVEPPSLDVASFVPSSFIQLPSPLKSFPLYTAGRVERCESYSQCLASSCLGCNKESLFSLVSSNRDQTLSLARASDDSLLAREVPLLLNGCQPFGRIYQEASADWLTPADLPPTTSNSHWCSLLFGDPKPGFSGTSSLDCFSVYPVVEWIGCVYHPAVITLLMHARDREHRPLDLSHPALRFMVTVTINHKPKEPEGIGGRRGRRREPCPRDHELVRSMASGLSGQAKLGRAYSVAVPAGGQLSADDLPSNVVRSLTTFDWRDNEVAASSRMLFPDTSGHSLEAKQSLFGGGSLAAFYQQGQQLLQTSCPAASGQSPMVADWRYTGGGHCQDTGESRQQLDYSTATPTISLYGSDDDDNRDISNEDVDGTDYDALSISSVNQAGGFFINGHLLATTSFAETTDALMLPSDAPPAGAAPPDDVLPLQYPQPRLQTPEIDFGGGPQLLMVTGAESQGHEKEEQQPSTTEEEESGQTTLSSHASIRSSLLRQAELPPPRSPALEVAVEFHGCSPGGEVSQTGKEPYRRASRATSGSPVGSRLGIPARKGSTTGSDRTQ